MALSERPLVDAALMAIEEINAAGGLFGCAIAPEIRDGASDADRFVEMTQQLIEVERVETIFGCWTSLSRKAVIPIVEKHNILLWYPVQYEGLEESSCVFYTGLCPNQQVQPALNWLMGQGRRRFYFVGSDYVFPRIVYKIIRGQLDNSQAAIVGVDFFPLGASDFSATVANINRVQPDAIFNTLNGDSNLAFYAQCAAAGIDAEQMPIMAVSISEVELQRIGVAATGHYACWRYFQSLDLPSNQRFVAKFKQRYGAIALPVTRLKRPTHRCISGGGPQLLPEP
ncbi:MAG: transporter substrate-binding protein [Spirulinaceae cyanobacterium SM2_1_0]|nr:transporter substrate-binding protein [Spirulinaceae cyanobacterium SM2_1_0]